MAEPDAVACWCRRADCCPSLHHPQERAAHERRELGEPHPDSWQTDDENPHDA